MAIKKANWEASLENLEANYDQICMSKEMVEKQIGLCKEKLAQFPVEEKPVEPTDEKKAEDGQ